MNETKFPAGKNKTPRISLPVEIGEAFGTCAALIIQQIHYWCVVKGHKLVGQVWVYNTSIKWAEQIRVYDPNTISRKIIELESKGVIVSGNFNKKAYDQTKWYRVDYEQLCAQLALYFPNRIFYPNPMGKITPMVSEEKSQPIPEDYLQKTNPEETNNAVKKHTALEGIPSGNPTPNPGEKEEEMKGPTVSAKVMASVYSGKPMKNQPHEVLVDVWRDVVPKHNENVKIVGAFTQKELAQVKKIATALGKDGPAVLTMVLSNWLGFNVFVRTQRDLKSAPSSPVVGFVLSHVALALNFYLIEKANADEQADESVSEIKVIAPKSSASVLGQVECKPQNKPGKITIKAKPKVGDAGIKEQVKVDEYDHQITLEELLVFMPFGKK